MKRHLFHIDILLSTVFLFVFIWIISATTGTNIFEPGKHDFEDFDYTDIAFSRAVNSRNAYDPSIVIVNTGDTDRAGIAAIIRKVNEHQPAAIGVDIVFKGERNRLQDSVLRAAISECGSKLVLAGELEANNKVEYGQFKPAAIHCGYANFFGEKNYVTRYFPPLTGNDTSFSIVVANAVKPGNVKEFLQRGHREEIINYRHSRAEYLVYDYHTLLTDQLDTNTLSGKIVLIGYCNDNEHDIEDMHFTPQNEKMTGRSLPDMRGVVVHANIISMIINQKYITPFPDWVNSAIMILLVWLCTALLLPFIPKHYPWFHIVVKLGQTAIVFAISFIDILLLKYCHLKSDSRPTILVIIFSVEILYLYEAISKWAQSYIPYNSIFKNH